MMFNIKDLSKNIKNLFVRNSPEILTGLGIAGMITTVFLAVKKTPKAMLLIERKKEELDTDTLTIPETIKTTWKCYIPVFVSGSISIACILGATSVNFKRNAALATAYKISEYKFSEYKNKVIDTIGNDKHKEITDKISKDRLQKKRINTEDSVFIENGNFLCYDSVTGREFESSYDKIKRVESELNKQLILNDYISLNDMYDELGLDRCSIGNKLGWRIDKGEIEIRITSHITDKGIPALVIDYDLIPDYDCYD